MILALTLSLALTAQVELRSQREPLPGQILSMGVDGVEVQGQGVIGWDRVRAIDGPQSAMFEQDFQGYADKAWRTRTRLARGDAIDAEPLFEELFQTYAWRKGPTARVVSEGLLRCRLRRNAQVSAVRAWLALLHAGGPGRTGLVDPRTSLVPTLPPIWLAAPALDRIDLSVPGDDPDADPMIAQLAGWYELAATFEAGAPIEMPKAST